MIIHYTVYNLRLTLDNINFIWGWCWNKKIDHMVLVEQSDWSDSFVLCDNTRWWEKWYQEKLITEMAPKENTLCTQNKLYLCPSKPNPGRSINPRSEKFIKLLYSNEKVWREINDFKWWYKDKKIFSTLIWLFTTLTCIVPLQCPVKI